MATSSFPQVHVTGVVHHYVRVATVSSSIWYLGTAEVTPQMQLRKYKQNVMNDLAGKTLPFQKTYDGEAATVSTLLTRFSNLAWNQIRLAGLGLGLVSTVGTSAGTGGAVPVGVATGGGGLIGTAAATAISTALATALSAASTTSGRESRWSRGAPVYGASTFELWQIFDNWFNPLKSDDIPIGFYWPQVELVQHDILKAGTQAEGVMFVLDCTPAWTGQASSSSVAPGDREWVLYSQNAANATFFPADITVPQ